MTITPFTFIWKSSPPTLGYHPHKNVEVWQGGKGFTPVPGGGDSQMKGMGMLIGKLE